MYFKGDGVAHLPTAVDQVLEGAVVLRDLYHQHQRPLHTCTICEWVCAPSIAREGDVCSGALKGPEMACAMDMRIKATSTREKQVAKC